eukprot:4100179-Ditylum_brightwellii.AAC.1
MSFILNPHNNILDLSNRNNRELFETGSKGLEDAQRFDGRKESFNNFAKLVSHQIKKDSPAAVLRSPKTIVNTFEKKEVSENTLKTHVDLVWANTGQDAYFWFYV